MAPQSQPNQIDLDTQRQNIRFQEILESLDGTLRQLNTSSKQIEFSSKLDDLMTRLIDRYGEDKSKINWEFNKTKGDMARAFAGEAAASNADSGIRMAEMSARMAQLESQLAMYAPTQFVQPSASTILPDASAIGTMRGEVQDTLNRGTYGAMSAGYFGRGITHPYFQDIGFAGLTLPTLGAGLTPMQHALRERQYMNDLAENSDPTEIRRFMDYQRNMFEESQKATFNRHISESMGVRGGYINRSDFEALVSPGVSSLAEDLGTSLDEAAMVVKKLRDLRVITQDIRSGSGADILNAVDDTARILSSVSRLIGSRDIQELVTTAGQLTQIGGGNFQTGLKLTTKTTDTILGPFRDPQYSIAHAAAMGQHYSSIFGGNTPAAVQMGAWDMRTRNLLTQYATGDYLNYVGGPEMAAQIYMPHLARRAAGVTSYIRDAGGGYDLLAGAGGLSDQASQDAVEFYSGMPRNMKKASDRQAGVTAEYNLMKEIQLYQNMFGMTEQEALLTVFGGDPTAVDAYREVQSAKDSFSDEFQRSVYAGRFSRVLRPAESYMFGDRRVLDYSTRERIGAGRGMDALGQIGYDIAVNPFVDTAEQLINMIPTVKKGGLASYQGLSDIKAVATDTTTGDWNFRKQLTDNKTGMMGHLVQIIGTAKASEAIEEVVTRIADMRGSFDFSDIQKILAKGVQEYVYSGQIDEGTSAAITEYIAGLTPQRALAEIGPRVAPDSLFFKLLQIGVDPSKSSMLLSTTEQYMRANLAGAMKEAGWSTSEIEQAVLSDENSVLKQGFNLVADNLLLSSVAATGVSALAGAGAVALGASAVATGGLTLVAAAGITALAWLGSEATSYYTVVAKGGAEVESIQEVLGTGEVSDYTSQIRALLVAIRSQYSDWYGINVLNVSDKIAAMAKSIVQGYADAYATYLSSIPKAERSKGTPLSEQRITTLADVITNSFAAKKLNPGQIDRMRNTVRSLLSFINSPNSPLGKTLRVENTLQASRSIQLDIDAQAAEISGQIGVLGDMREAVGSMENLLGRAAGNEAGMLEALTSGTQASKNIETQFSAVADIITVKAKNAEERKASETIMSTIRKAYEDRDYSLVQNLSASDLDLAKSVLGEDFTEGLKRLKGEDAGVIKRELSTIMSSKLSASMSEMERRQAASRGVVEIFMDASNAILSNPELSLKVTQLGQLMRGD